MVQRRWRVFINPLVCFVVPYAYTRRRRRRRRLHRMFPKANIEKKIMRVSSRLRSAAQSRVATIRHDLTLQHQPLLLCIDFHFHHPPLYTTINIQTPFYRLYTEISAAHNLTIHIT